MDKKANTIANNNSAERPLGHKASLAKLGGEKRAFYPWKLAPVEHRRASDFYKAAMNMEHFEIMHEKNNDKQ